MTNPKEKTDRAWLEINLANLEYNVKTLTKAMPPKCRLMAVVKADGYGHGAFKVSAHLNKIGVNAFAVATIDEGIKLRKYGIRGEILILGYTNVCRAAELKKYDLTQTLIDFDYAEALNKQGAAIKSHLKVDTGMHRLGIDSKDVNNIQKIFAMKNLKICGIYTHLCCAESLDPDDIAFTRKQIDAFYSLINPLIETWKARGMSIPKIHIQSSYGLLNYPDLVCDYVRAGIALYGVPSSPNVKTKLNLPLRPVLSLKTRIILIRSVCPGESVGYDRAFRAERESRIAILPVGYGDGFPRNLSCQNGKALINGRYAPIIGRICMDQMAVDITDIENASLGDMATLISADEDADWNAGLQAPAVAERSHSISNELLCRLGKRLPIVAYCNNMR